MKGFKVTTIIVIVIIALTLVVAGVLLSRVSTPSTQTSNPSNTQVTGLFVKDQDAPDYVLTDFDGNPHKISDYKGKVVVLDFWAAWCPFCVDEMPELQKAQDENKDNVVIVGIHRTDTESIETGNSFAQKRGVKYLLVSDEDGKLYDASGSFGMPVAIYVDKKGIVREIKIGPKTADEINTTIKGLL